jgi:predicted DNA-binding transcriptional regulator AlpA
MSKRSTDIGHNGGPPLPDDDDALDPRQASEFLNISLSTLWRQTTAGVLPQPFYPTLKSPRWVKSELRQARERLRMMPHEAKGKRRAASLAAARLSSTTIA